MKLKIELKSFRLVPPCMYNSWPSQLVSSVKGDRASLTEMSSWERPYFDFKLDRATQLSDGTRGSKYSAHHSQLSDFSILASYVIPTVRFSLHFQCSRNFQNEMPCQHTQLCAFLQPWRRSPEISNWAYERAN